MLSSPFPRLKHTERHGKPVTAGGKSGKQEQGGIANHVWVYINVFPLCSLCLCGFAFNTFGFYRNLYSAVSRLMSWCLSISLFCNLGTFAVSMLLATFGCFSLRPRGFALMFSAFTKSLTLRPPRFRFYVSSFYQNLYSVFSVFIPGVLPSTVTPSIHGLRPTGQPSAVQIHS